MAYLFAPRPSFRELPVFYNVEGAVGATPAMNLREDVLLVQFILSFIVKAPKPTYTPQMIAACKLISISTRNFLLLSQIGDFGIQGPRQRSPLP